MSSNASPLRDSADELQQLRSLVSYNSDWLWEVDAAGRYTFSSEHSRQILGVTPQEVVGRTPFDFMPPDEAQRVGRVFNAIVEGRKPFSGLINRNVHANGAIVVLETSGVPLFAADGRFTGYRGIDRDVTDSVGPLDSRVTQLEALYEAAPVALALLDRNGSIVNANEAAVQMLAPAEGAVLGRSIKQILPPEALDLCSYWQRLQLGSEVPDVELHWGDRAYQVRVRPVRDAANGLTGLILAFSDITELHLARVELAAGNIRLASLAASDHLTGLPNRRRFDEYLLDAIRRASRDGSAVSLILLDVDHFKQYNDCYGHQRGDECLRVVATVLSAHLHRAGDLACRYGGEEFAVVLPNTEAKAAWIVAERMRLAILKQGIIHPDAPLGCVTISLGIASVTCIENVSISDDQRVAQLLDGADANLYSAKNAGRNNTFGASQAMDCVV